MNLGPRIDLQPKPLTIMPADKAYALAATLNADDDGSCRYEVGSNRNGYFIVVKDAETGDEIGTL